MAGSYRGAQDLCSLGGMLVFHHLLLLLIPVIWKQRKGQVTLGFPTTSWQFGPHPAFHGMGEEKLAAGSNEDGSLSPSRAPLFPKPGEPCFAGARGSKKAAWRVDFCLRHPPYLQAPTALPCLPLAVWTRCNISCISDLEMLRALQESMSIPFQSCPRGHPLLNMLLTLLLTSSPRCYL